MMMLHTVLLAALVPLAFGEYSYTYEYTDAPSAAPTAETMSPTTSGAPTRSETYAPTRMTEAPSYAPTTDTYAPTMAPTATAEPSAPTPTGCDTIPFASGNICTTDPSDLGPGKCDGIGFECYSIAIPTCLLALESDCAKCKYQIQFHANEDTGAQMAVGCCSSNPNLPPSCPA
jgi:hypothetical protein